MKAGHFTRGLGLCPVCPPVLSRLARLRRATTDWFLTPPSEFPIAMKLRHWITAIALLLLVAAAITGMVWTRALRPPPESHDSAATPAGKKLLARTQAANERPLVDQRPLQTARRMAALAVTPEELWLAHEAEKVGDHEADLAFADGLRTAALNPPKLTAEAKEVGVRKAKADAAVRAEPETIAPLTRRNSGHPAGRRVWFMNSFAIEDHFFNFSTSGLGMWDELQLAIPADPDSYAVVEQLQQLVAKDTGSNARKAEEEWRSATTRYRVRSLSAEPAPNVRPTGSGVELRVRYITRAYEQAVVDLMHKKPEEVAR
jgi:hypothetical protein